MKRLVLALALLCSARAEAQVSYTLSNFTPFANQFGGGFDVQLLFRNTSTYADPQALAITAARFGVANRVLAFCEQAGVQICESNGMQGAAVGNVQTGDFSTGFNSYLYSKSFYTNSCNGCTTISFWDLAMTKVFGCALSAGALTSYAGRTCDADGFTGSLSIDLRFRYSLNQGGVQSQLRFDDFVQDDALISFDIQDYGANVALVTPEPSTWAMLMVGLGVVGMVQRKRT